uniref:C2H2-type domain-containing protein n=1 Tax=Echeneis naucrates TaxID=173247 RepID=A0A665WE02_ECHNA
KQTPAGHMDKNVCPVCGKGFQYIRPFMKHLKTHNRTCESTKELLSNLQSAHSKRLVCDVCGKTFTNPGCLHIHSKIHTGIKDFKCQDCGKSFVRKEHLTVHMRTHSGERPYHCDVCGRAFTQSQNLKVHRLTHSGEKRYQCGSCGKLFYTHGQLKKHMKHFSGDKGSTEKDGPFLLLIETIFQLSASNNLHINLCISTRLGIQVYKSALKVLFDEAHPTDKCMVMVGQITAMAACSCLGYIHIQTESCWSRQENSKATRIFKYDHKGTWPGWGY